MNHDELPTVDEKITSGQVFDLNEKFDRSLDIYFDANGNMLPEVLEYVTCPNCANTEGQNFKQKRFNYIRCSRCGMVYVSPRFKESINEEIHSQDRYEEHYKLKVLPSFEYRKNVLAKRKYIQLMQFFNKPGKVLDIGCGLGDVLSVFNEHDWECLGIDFNQYATEFVRKKFGINVINENIIDHNINEKFDLIMLWGVVEHLYQPKKLLKVVHSLLKDEGLVLIEVPSADSLLVRYCENTGNEAYRTFEAGRHLMLFSIKSLSEIIEECGFKCVKLLSNGLDVSTINRMNKLDLADSHISQLQKILDDSMEGDLLRGFYKKI